MSKCLVFGQGSSGNNPRPPCLLSQKEPAFPKPDSTLWRARRGSKIHRYLRDVQQVSLGHKWDMCSRWTRLSSGMRCSHALRSCLRSSSFGVPEHGWVCGGFIHKQQRQGKKIMKTETVFTDSRKRLCSATTGKAQPRGTPRSLPGGGLCVHPVHPFLYFVTQKALFGLGHICFSSKSQPKEEVLMMFNAHSVIFYIPKHASYLWETNATLASLLS